MKIKYLILVVLLKKTSYNTKVTETENRLDNNNNHDRHVTTPEFNDLTADVFNIKLAQTNLVTKIDFDTKFLQIKQNVFLLKTNLKSWNHLIGVILLDRVTLKKMVCIFF